MIRGPFCRALGCSFMIRWRFSERVQFIRWACVVVDRRIAITAICRTASTNGIGARTTAAFSENEETDARGDCD
jgi:hypothetical protein